MLSLTGVFINEKRTYKRYPVSFRGFFGGIKYDWALNVGQSARDHMKKDVTDYIRYYNNERLHASNNDMSLVNYELAEVKVSCLG